MGQNVATGATVTFTAVASGSATPTYQWQLNGVNITGATGSSLVLTNVQTSDAGTYAVVATIASSSTTSNGAVLTVQVGAVLPAITTQPVSQTVTTGANVTFTAAASGSPVPTFQWRKNGTNISGATNASLALSNVQLTDAATYSVVASNSVGSATSSGAILTVNSANSAPVITTQPSNQTVTTGATATFTAAASGSPTPTYQWKKSGVNVSGGTSATLTITNAQSANAGSYTVVATNSLGSVTSNAATLTVNPPATVPVITTQPLGQTVTIGSTVSLTVAATGSPTPTYQWKKNGTNISGATSTTLSFSNIQASSAGTYTVVATNSAGSATSASAVLNVVAPTVPVITTQPSNRTVALGTNVSFTAAATGLPTPTYQWQKNGVNISGATSGTLTLTNVSAASAGTYTLFAINSAGTTASNGAVLSVYMPPVILSQPSSQTATIGTTVTFSVFADSSNALTYQWLRNGIPISGETGSAYQISGIQLSHAANYSVFISNALGSVTSSAAVLTVNVPVYPTGFDALGYLARNPDVANAVGSDLNAAWQHYLNYGINEARVYDDLFRVDEYLGLYGDLQATIGNSRQGALLHWLNYGKAEGRLGRVPLTFDIAGYLARYADLQAVFGALPVAQRNVGVWNHYLDYGVYEGRSDGDFGVYAYLAEYADLQAAFGSNLEAAALHWYIYGRYEGRRIPLNFDVQNYLTLYPDIEAIYDRDLYGAWLYYRDYGINAGQVYDNLFRVDEYLALYADLRTAFGTDREAALMHWLLYGKAEGRSGRF